MLAQMISAKHLRKKYQTRRTEERNTFQLTRPKQRHFKKTELQSIIRQEYEAKNLNKTYAMKLNSLIYKNIMSNISNWKSIFPITKITSTPYPTSKINNVLNTFDKSYIYSCYYNFKP